MVLFLCWASLCRPVTAVSRPRILVLQVCGVVLVLAYIAVSVLNRRREQQERKLFWTVSVELTSSYFLHGIIPGLRKSGFRNTCHNEMVPSSDHVMEWTFFAVIISLEELYCCWEECFDRGPCYQSGYRDTTPVMFGPTLWPAKSNVDGGEGHWWTGHPLFAFQMLPETRVLFYWNG